MTVSYMGLLFDDPVGDATKINDSPSALLAVLTSMQHKYGLQGSYPPQLFWTGLLLGQGIHPQTMKPMQDWTAADGVDRVTPEDVESWSALPFRDFQVHAPRERTTVIVGDSGCLIYRGKKGGTGEAPTGGPSKSRATTKKVMPKSDMDFVAGGHWTWTLFTLTYSGSTFDDFDWLFI